MTALRERAPIYVDAMALCEWIFVHFDNREAVLPRTLCTTALSLVESVAIALRGRSRYDQVEAADDHLGRLRVELRLALARGLLDERQALYALDQANAIGRQIGGWLRDIGPA